MSARELSIADVEALLSDFVSKDVLLRDAPLGREEDIFAAGFDSLSLSRLLVFIEERLGAKIPDDAIVVDEIETLEKMASFVHRYLQSSAG